MNTINMPQPLVSTEWLAGHIDHPMLEIIDASWYLPQMSRNAPDEYRKGHIPGAVFADIDILSDLNTRIPHNMPRPDDFAEQLEHIGISSDNCIVIYDGGLPTAARLWFMLKSIGHKHVAVLNGGFQKWKSEDRPVTQEIPSKKRGSFHAQPLTGYWVGINEADTASRSDTIQVVDARNRERYEGAVQEPRPGVRAGHIPTARSLPFLDLINTQTGLFEDPKTISKRFSQAGVDMNIPTVAYCGSGLTACNIALASQLIDGPPVQIYDGSWAEWGASDKSIETGSPYNSLLDEN